MEICPHCNKELKRIINVYTPENIKGDFFCYECDKLIDDYEQIWRASRGEYKKGRTIFIENNTAMTNEEFYKRYKIKHPMEEI